MAWWEEIIKPAKTLKGAATRYLVPGGPLYRALGGFGETRIASEKEAKGEAQPFEIAQTAEAKRKALRERGLSQMLEAQRLAEGEPSRIASAFGEARGRLAEAGQLGQRAIREEAGRAVAAGASRGTRATGGLALEAASEAGTRIANFLGQQREREAALAMQEQQAVSGARAGAIQQALKATQFEREMGDELSDLRQQQMGIQEIIAANRQGIGEFDDAYAERIASIAAAEGYDPQKAKAAALAAKKGQF